MSDKLREAAERWKANVYRDFDSLNASRQQCYDSATLADAYLVEHPADDGEKVTEEWLLASGFTPHPEFRGHSIYNKTQSIEVWIADGGICVEGEYISRKFGGDYTRGDMRRLCSALGIELKSPEPT